MSDAMKTPHLYNLAEVFTPSAEEIEILKKRLDRDEAERRAYVAKKMSSPPYADITLDEKRQALHNSGLFTAEEKAKLNGLSEEKINSAFLALEENIKPACAQVRKLKL